MTKGKNNITGVTGEYFVCAELGYRNILAIPTPKNNPLFDLLAADLQAERIVAIQVKTMSKGNKQGWRLNKGIIIPKNNPNLFAILVNLKNDGGCDYYIFRYDELSKKVRENYEDYLSTNKRDGTPRKDVDFRWFNLKEFTAEDHLRKNDWSVLGF